MAKKKNDQKGPNDMTIKKIMSIVALCAVPLGCDVDPLLVPGEFVEEETYEELSRQWYQWFGSQPYTEGSVTDETGERCHLNQSYGAWMLAGTTGGSVERECTIPPGRPIFFPMINRFISLGATPEDEITEDDWAFVPDFFASRRATTCSLTLELDGEPLLEDTEAIDEHLYVAVEEPFSVELLDDNFFAQWGKEGGVYDASFTDGHFALLQLMPGDHTLRFGGAICNAETGETTFETEAIYTLHIE